MARRVFDVKEEDDLKAAKMLSGKVIEWFESVGMYYKLSDVNIDSEKFELMANDVMRMFGNPEKDRIDSIIPTSVKDIVEIYNMAK